MAEKIISPNVFITETNKNIVSRGNIETGAAVVGPTVKGDPLVPTIVTSYSEYVSKFGDKFKSGSQYYEYFTSFTAKEYFDNGGRSLLVTRIVSGSNYSSYASSSLPSYSSTGSNSIVLESLHFGVGFNNSSSLSSNGALTLGTADNFRWEVSDVNTSAGTFTLLIRSGNDLTSNKNILETWPNLSLDPQQANFVSRVIGDQKLSYVSDDDGYIQYEGNYPVSSEYVRVKSISTYHIDSLDNEGIFKASIYSGSLPALGSGSLGGAFNGGVVDTDRAGYFFENILQSSTNSQGFVADDYTPAFNLLSNKDQFDFDLLFVPGLFLGANANVNTVIPVSLCESRGDAFCIMDPVASDGTKTQAKAAKAASNSSYGAGYWSWQQIYSANLGKLVYVPGSVVAAGAFAFNDRVGQKWFAPAGLGRGDLSSVVRPARILSTNDRNDLYSANINPIQYFPNEGVKIWGQKTFQTQDIATNRINVRRLLIDLKRFVGRESRKLVFEGNDNATRNSFLSTVNPYFETVKQKRGLYVYTVIMDDTNNTGDVIDRQQLKGQIVIKPIKTAEFIMIDFTLDPTGITIF